MAMEADRIPLIVLTGFLGAGKTTVLNRVLHAQHRWRVAVIVNELGRIDIDAKLLKARSGDVVELAGGCVCHEVRTQEELWGAMDEVIARSRPQRIVLETTGIAEPGLILDGLAALPPERAAVASAAVVTVVDADAGVGQLERHPEARAQVAEADRLLVTKLDLCDAARLAGLHRALDALNPGAARAAFPSTEEGTRDLVAWLLDSPGRRARPGKSAARQPSRTGHGHGHDHSDPHGQIVAAAFAEDLPLVAEPLVSLCARLGPALLRAKGFVQVAGESRPGFLERAGNQMGITFDRSWPPGPKRTELVFIGEGLDPGAIQRELWACRATGDVRGSTAEGQGKLGG